MPQTELPATLVSDLWFVEYRPGYTLSLGCVWVCHENFKKCVMSSLLGILSPGVQQLDSDQDCRERRLKSYLPRAIFLT